MASLKDLRVRIGSVKNTRKITSAMKMVAASKLRRAQEAAEAARPYARRMEAMLGRLAASAAGQADAPRLLAGTGRQETHLIVVLSADRGLCGAFNGNVVRAARQTEKDLRAAGQTVKFLCVGRKAREALKRDFAAQMIPGYEHVLRRGVEFSAAETIAKRILQMFDEGAFDVCSLVYNQFKSAISQVAVCRRLVPFAVPEPAAAAAASTEAAALYDYEPGEEALLEALLPRNLAVQMFAALLESDASEQGARMSAMDNATRNAGEMIDRLTLLYNRTRQAMITKELIEIISGAEAL